MTGATDLVALADRDGDVVEVTGRYEAWHVGGEPALGPDGPTPWSCTVELSGGGSLRLGGRPDAEREAMLGRAVRARGRLELAPAGAPSMPMLHDPTVHADGELPLYDPVPRWLAGERRIVEVLTTHLQMFARPTAALPPAPDGVRVMRAGPPGIRFYRFLYEAVGSSWHWYDRRRWPDDELAATVDDPRVEIHVAYRHGTPAGYVELDGRDRGECEIAYFGLLPEAIGHGIGAWLLRWAVDHAWRTQGLERLWVHTCTLDHPTALPLYQKVGFRPFEHERHRQFIVEP